MKTVAIIYNTSHYVFAFKQNLIKHLQDNGYKIIVLAPYDSYSDKLSQLNVDYYPIKMDNSGSNPLKDTVLILNLYMALKKFKPDCILSFTIKPNIYGSLAASLLNIPVICNITGLGTVFVHGGLRLRIIKLLYKYAFKFPKKVLFQNKDDMNIFLSEKLISNERAELIPGSGVDIEKFKPTDETHRTGYFTFLLIGRIIRDKGIMEYIQAAKTLKEKYQNIEFQILGFLNVRSDTCISEEELSEYVSSGIIKLFPKTEDVRPFIAASDVVVLPSYGGEGVPRTILEACAMAKPVVCTNVPGCRDLVVEGENGFLCTPKSAESLAEKMEKLITTSKDDLKKMGISGRKRIAELFDEKIVLNKYTQLLKELTGK